MSNHAEFERFLGHEEYYRDFLLFFQKEMDRVGYEKVVNEYLLKGDERADDLLARLYAGMSVWRLCMDGG